MKKLFTLLLILTLSFLLTSCTNPKKENTVDLNKIKADATLAGKVYNEVCFNVYKVNNKNGKTTYKHISVQCYLVKVDDYENGIENAKITDFETLSDQILVFNKANLVATGDTKYYAPIYNAKQEDLQPLPPICRINDENASTCISTYWVTRGGITDNYAIIYTDDDEE